MTIFCTSYRLVFPITLRLIIDSYDIWQRDKDRKRDYLINDENISKGVIEVRDRMWGENRAAKKYKGKKTLLSIN